MTFTRSDVAVLAKKPKCPRCDLNKTIGHALCRTCRSKLPQNMRAALEKIPGKDAMTVTYAMRQAANYFTVHFQSIRNFGGGKKR